MTAKYLGVILDVWLTWRVHVDAKARKACNMLWASSVRWGVRPSVVHISVVRPSISFASLVW
jgi:hypothetical protein